jgi:dipeptidase E
MRLLLLSNSTAPGRKYLEHVMDVLSEVLADVRRLAEASGAPAEGELLLASLADRIDAVAAAVILQSYLDAVRFRQRRAAEHGSNR